MLAENATRGTEKMLRAFEMGKKIAMVKHLTRDGQKRQDQHIENGMQECTCLWSQ